MFSGKEAKMKAIIYEKYGSPDVLRLKDVEKPAPRENEVLIKVFATTVTKYDCWMRSCTAPPGFGLLMRLASGKKPKQPILGTELAGEIEAVGVDVTRFKVGDQVFGYPGMNLGAYAEYICLPEEAVALKPANLTYEEAAAVLQGALTARFFLRKANIQPGDKVLIFGASGGVGGYAVQLAKHHFGAEVTGVCRGSKMAYVKSLGADQVIDYTQEDFTKSGQRYDLILDNVANHSLSDFRRALTPKGTLLPNGGGHSSGRWIGPMGSIIKALVLSLFVRQQGHVFLSLPNKEDLATLKELVESGKVTPVIDRTYPLSETPEAIGYLGEGHARGKVVITV
jgi:NADPH:quinone reductase-like Zn-dependent oxidoreductase